MSLRRLKNLVFWLPPDSAIASRLQPQSKDQPSAPSLPRRFSTPEELRRFFGASVNFTPN